jgi:hypothetical protein
MILNANVELDTNIHITPFPPRNITPYCCGNVFQSLIMSAKYSILNTKQ